MTFISSGLLAYGVSKVGMMALTRIQSRELAKSGKEDILVNLVRSHV